MGGRGSWSRTHGGVRESGGADGQLYVSKERDMRKDIRQLFVNELGFKDVVGTGDIPVAQLGALGIQLKKLEKQHGVLANGNVILAATGKNGVKGAAAVAADGSMVLFVNPSAHSSVKGYRETLKGEQKADSRPQPTGRSQTISHIRRDMDTVTSFNSRLHETAESLQIRYAMRYNL